MAVSVTTDLVTITAAESTTDAGTFYRLNGTSSGNPAQDLDAFVQGTACVANKMGASSGVTDTGGHFNHTTTFDLSGGKHLYHWRQIVTAGNMLTKANQGVVLGLTNTSVTSNTAWSATNFKKWFIDGSDQTKAAKGWECYVVDPASTPDQSAGALTLTSVKNVGFICRQNSGVTSTVSNQFIDVVRAGTGVTATASAGGDVIDIAGIFATDSATANMWGVVTQSNGVYYGAGKITIGATGQTNVCNFTDADRVLIWKNFPVALALYAINLVSNATWATTFQITGWVVRGQAGKGWDIVCDSNSRFRGLGCSFANIRQATLSANSLLDGCSIDASGTIDTNGATINNCAFSNHTGTQLKIDSTVDIAAVTGNSFVSGGTGHAIEITVPGTYALSGNVFSGYGASGTVNAAVYNNSGGAVTLNISGNGSTPTVRNGAGASTVVNNSKTLTLTGLVAGSDVVILTAGSTTVLAQADQHPSSSYVYSYSTGGTVDIGILKPGYVPLYVRNYTLGVADTTLPISQVQDRNFL